MAPFRVTNQDATYTATLLSRDSLTNEVLCPRTTLTGFGVARSPTLAQQFLTLPINTVQTPTTTRTQSLITFGATGAGSYGSYKCFEWGGWNQGTTGVTATDYYTNFQIKGTGLYEFQLSNFQVSGGSPPGISLFAWNYTTPNTSNPVASKLVQIGAFNPNPLAYFSTITSGVTYENKIVTYINSDLVLNYTFYLVVASTSALTFIGPTGPTLSVNIILPTNN
jgi:hypothetical protein